MFTIVFLGSAKLFITGPHILHPPESYCSVIILVAALSLPLLSILLCFD